MSSNLKYISAFKALGDINRMKIMKMLSYGELCACKILERLELTQSTLSHHMKILCDNEIVVGRKDGKWMHYSINEEVLKDMGNFLNDLVNENRRGVIIDSPESKDKIHLYLLTGFLGSGKTTVMLKILEALQSQRVGVIQNEFGKLGIDGTILKRDNIEMTEINRGSIFCSCLQVSFVQALAEMSKLNLRYLFVESSGLSDPSNIEEIIDATKVIAGDKYEFKGAICLVDGVNFMEQLNDLETVNRQLKHCHLAVITKVDLIDSTQLERVKEEIRKINPICPITLSSNGDLDFEFLNKDLLEYQWAEGEDTTNTEDTKPKTISLNFTGEVDKEKLEGVLNDVKKSTYRIKGFFKIKNLGWNQIDVVGSNIDYKPCDEKEISQLVFISKIGPKIIKEVFNSWEKHIDEKMELKN